MSEDELARAILKEGYAFAQRADMSGWLGAGSDWEAFAASWNDLRVDQYRPAESRDRLRRHAVLSLAPGATPRLESDQPHYQSSHYNRLYGGLERWYEPVTPEVAAGDTMRRVLRFCGDLFGRLRPATTWKIEMHQFRIEAKAGLMGQPTPEGLHRDGVDFVLAMMVRRENVSSGTTTVHDAKGAALGSFTLTQPLDAAFVDDARVLHGVTPVAPVDLKKPAYRDVLVVTFAGRGTS